MASGSSGWEAFGRISSYPFLSPLVALHLYKSTTRPSMEYCCHVWAGVLSCYLDILDKLQILVCSTSPTLAASLDPLSLRRM